MIETSYHNYKACVMCFFPRKDLPTFATYICESGVCSLSFRKCPSHRPIALAAHSS